MGAGFGILFLVFALLPLLLLLASVVGLIWLWTRVFRHSESTREARCSACDYSVRGAREFTCVECGADLRVVGIKTPASRRMVGPVAFLLLWTMLLPLPSCTGAGLMLAVGPKRPFHYTSLSLTPNSGQYRSLDIDNGSGIGAMPFQWLFVGVSGVPIDPVGLSLEDNQQNWDYIQIDPATMTYDAWMHGSSIPLAASASSGASTAGAGSGNPTQRAAFDRAAVLSWFGQTGGGTIDVTDPAVIAEADELVQLLPRFNLAGSTPVTLAPAQFSVSQNHSYSDDWPAEWWCWAVGAFWLLVYAAGVVLYVVIRRRRHARVLPDRDPYGPAQFAPPAS